MWEWWSPMGHRVSLEKLVFYARLRMRKLQFRMKPYWTVLVQKDRKSSNAAGL